MEKKLYLVKVVLFVMAEDEGEACAAATRAHFDISNAQPGKQSMSPRNGMMRSL